MKGPTQVKCRPQLFFVLEISTNIRGNGRKTIQHSPSTALISNLVKPKNRLMKCAKCLKKRQKIIWHPLAALLVPAYFFSLLYNSNEGDLS